MKIEHIAFNVTDSKAAAQWYVQHLGMKILREIDDDRDIVFLADSDGTTRLELYNNHRAEVLDYPNMHPFILHIAFNVDDMQPELDRLIAAGAVQFGDIETTAAGDLLVILRDPWGLSLQLVKRQKPL